MEQRRPDYCRDVVGFIDLIERLDSSQNVVTPVLFRFGDSFAVRGDNTFDIPILAKCRAAASKPTVATVTGAQICLSSSRPPLKTMYHQGIYDRKLSPIIWNLNTARHWNPLPWALAQDTPWEKKRNKAFWGGAMTGGYRNLPNMTDRERCQSNDRCRFVLDHFDSKLIDARLTANLDGVRRFANGTVDGMKLTREQVGWDVIQEYKVIISIEGNDVASGLKWNLQSESVVVMAPPTKTSWAMEELLEPWVHYIPMFPDGSNAEEMVRWALDNENEARRISERASLFIYDLLYHPDAVGDEQKVKAEIARRYRALWY
jgi:hypothetical protein